MTMFRLVTRPVPIARRLTAVGLLLAAAPSLRAQRPAPPPPRFAGFERYAEDAMALWKVPGMAVAVVRGDTVLLSRGFGVRTVGDTARVDDHTLFAIGSTTKAFTGAALAMLADDGKLRFDGKVIDYLPAFQLADPWVTRELTVRDLLLHRSGLDRGDAIFYGTTRSRASILAALRFLPASAPFRTRFGYHNLMYIAAGEVVASVAGTSWDDFIQHRVFDPLGMTASNTSITRLAGKPNVATPHGERDDTVAPMPWRNIDNAAASGSINSNARDMAAWLRLWVNGGVFEGRRLLSNAMVAEAITPQFVVDDPTFTARLMSSGFLGYGFGWFVTEHRGRRWVLHGGNIDGMAALVSFLPEERLGVVILTNKDQSDIIVPLTASLFDRALRLDSIPDYNARYYAAEQAALKQAQAARRPTTRVSGTKPSLPIQAYQGRYDHPFMGSLVVSADSTGLSISYPDGPTLRGRLEHWHFDSFVAHLADPVVREVRATFRIGADGRVAAVHFPLGGNFTWIRQ